MWDVIELQFPSRDSFVVCSLHLANQVLEVLTIEKLLKIFIDSISSYLEKYIALF
jgi:hypothetical protein